MNKEKVLTTLILIWLILPQAQALAEWQPPIGIPKPEFGIEETYRMYDDPANRNPELTYTQNLEGGFYTHYVDNTHPAATSSNNAYGTASKPRQTLPSGDLPAGSIVEIHGGPYTYTNSFLVKGYGTAALPIFVRGVDTGENTPYFNGFLHPEGTYLIVEGLSAVGCFVMGENGGSRDSKYVSVRNNEIYPLDQYTGGGIGVMGEYSSSGTERAENVVIYNNTLHDFGDVYSPEDNDWGGISVGYFTNDVWIIDNEIYNSPGSGVQINSGKYDPPLMTERVYVARNHIHHMRSAGVWVKYGNDIVFSQNLIHDIYNKEALWTEEAKGMGYQYWPYNVWYIFNAVYNVVRGFVGTTGNPTQAPPGMVNPPNAYVIGNVFHSYKEASNPAWVDLDWAAIASSGRSSTHIIGNIVHSYPVGMGVQDLDKFIIMNNIIMDADVTKGHEHLWIEKEVAPFSTLENNLFYQSNGSVVINWGGPIYNDMDTLRAQTSTGQGCMVADPQFINPSTGDFHPQPTSPAIDNGILSDVYQTYYDTFGVDIKKDIEGRIRPLDGDNNGTAEWDIGAYEYGSTILYGDVSENGTISATDAAMAARHAVGLINLTPKQTTAADVTGNGAVSATDASWIARKSVDPDIVFPVEE